MHTLDTDYWWKQRILCDCYLLCSLWQQYAKWIQLLYSLQYRSFWKRLGLAMLCNAREVYPEIWAKHWIAVIASVLPAWRTSNWSIWAWRVQLPPILVSFQVFLPHCHDILELLCCIFQSRSQAPYHLNHDCCFGEWILEFSVSLWFLPHLENLLHQR